MILQSFTGYVHHFLFGDWALIRKLRYRKVDITFTCPARDRSIDAPTRTRSFAVGRDHI